MRKLLLIILLLHLLLPCQAQLSITQHFNASNGLSNNFVHGIVQDSKGRVWIATESGLNCYDGYHFTIYKSHNSPLKSNYLNAIYRDSQQQKIWIGVKGYGIYLLDENTGIISDVTPHKFNINNVMSISSASDGGIWIVCHDKIVHYSYKQGKFSLFQSVRHKEAYRNALDDQKGHLIIAGYYHGIQVVHIKDKKKVRIHAANRHIDKETINRFELDKDGNIWIASNFGLRKLNCHKLQLEYIDKIDASSINDVKIYGKQMMLATNSDIRIVNISNLTILQKFDIWGAWNIYKDKYHNIWLGANGNGVHFLSINHNPFKRILSNGVWCIIPDGNNIWAGGTNTLYLLSQDKLVHTYSIPSQIASGVILSMQEEDNQHILLSIAGKLVKFDKQTGYFCEVKYNGRNISAITFYKDQKNTIWMATNNGIYSIKNGIVSYEHKLNKVLGNQVTNCIRIDALDNIWVGTIESGIYIFNKQHQLTQHLAQSNSFFSNTIMHMRNGKKNRLWLATSEGIGLIENTAESSECSHYNYKQGLKDPFIRTLQEDLKGNLWVSTNNGLSFLNMKTHLFSNFDQNDGIPTNNFTGGLYLNSKGIAYATSLDGIISFDTNYLTAKRQTSPIYITRCAVLNASVEQMSEQIMQPKEDGTYLLNHNQNDIRVSFATANKAQSKLVDYSYKVDNLVNEWTVTDENTITFRSLTPGKYIIQVRARLHGQSWDTASTTSMTVMIAQPFWWTWQARTLYLLLLIAIIIFSSRRYKHHLQIKNDLELERRKNIAEQDINRERLQFFTNIAHEIRTPLSLIYGPIMELEQSKNLNQEDRYQVTVIQKNSNRLMELINRLLEFRKVETNNRQLIVCKGNLKECIQGIGENFKATNQNENVTYIIDLEETSPFIYFDKEVIKSILSNLLNNASKYTEKGNIGLSLTQVVKAQHQYSCIKVWDTGCGIAEEAIPHIFERYYQANGIHQASGTGIGLALVKKLCEQHHIQISIESDLGKGTVFTLLIDNEESYTYALHQENNTQTQEGTYLQEPKTTEKEPMKTEESHPTLLIVEDNVEINNYISHSLKAHYNILQASNGQEGLQMASDRMPDIIICDIMMPIMDGFTMTKRLKNELSTSHIPVIILTAKTSTEDQQRCYECGADSFITKPFSINLLKSRINNIFDSQKTTASFILQKINAKSPASEDNQEKPKLSTLDQKFLAQINAIIQENISSEKLNLVFIAELLKVSQSTLYRKMKALTGVSGNEYIRKMRLSNSLHLMLEANKNISEAAYESGFIDLAYFRTCFKEEYGEVPSDYLKKHYE